jgi:hypothetical protein
VSSFKSTTQSGEEKVPSAKKDAKTCALSAPETLIFPLFLAKNLLLDPSQPLPPPASIKRMPKKAKMRGVGFEPTRENPIRNFLFQGNVVSRI